MNDDRGPSKSTAAALTGPSGVRSPGALPVKLPTKVQEGDTTVVLYRPRRIRRKSPRTRERRPTFYERGQVMRSGRIGGALVIGGWLLLLITTAIVLLGGSAGLG